MAIKFNKKTAVVIFLSPIILWFILASFISWINVVQFFVYNNLPEYTMTALPNNIAIVILNLLIAIFFVIRWFKRKIKE